MTETRKGTLRIQPPSRTRTEPKLVVMLKRIPWVGALIEALKEICKTRISEPLKSDPLLWGLRIMAVAPPHVDPGLQVP